jgi:hypothetical protein
MRLEPAEQNHPKNVVVHRPDEIIICIVGRWKKDGVIDEEYSSGIIRAT